MPWAVKETYDLLQQFITQNKRRSPKPGNGKKSLFCGLVYCADCGSKLWFNINRKNDAIRFFNCSNYRGNRGTCDSTHYVREDALEAIVRMELKRLASYQGYSHWRCTGVMPTNISQHCASPNTKRNPNPSPIGKRLGFLLFGADVNNETSEMNIQNRRNIFHTIGGTRQLCRFFIFDWSKRLPHFYL